MGFTRFAFVVYFLSVLVSLTQAQGSQPVQVRILLAEEGNSVSVLSDLIAGFEAENPDITVELDVIQAMSVAP